MKSVFKNPNFFSTITPDKTGFSRQRYKDLHKIIKHEYFSFSFVYLKSIIATISFLLCLASGIMFGLDFVFPKHNDFYVICSLDQTTNQLSIIGSKMPNLYQINHNLNNLHKNYWNSKYITLVIASVMTLITQAYIVFSLFFFTYKKKFYTTNFVQIVNENKLKDYKHMMNLEEPYKSIAPYMHSFLFILSIVLVTWLLVLSHSKPEALSTTYDGYQLIDITCKNYKNKIDIISHNVNILEYKISFKPKWWFLSLYIVKMFICFIVATDHGILNKETSTISKRAVWQKFKQPEFVNNLKIKQETIQNINQYMKQYQ